MLHRSSALSSSAQPCICVPAIPTDTIRYISDGGTSRMTSALPNAGGGGFSPLPAGPSPMPRNPWHDAQYWP